MKPMLIAFGGGLALIVGARLIVPGLGGATIAAALAVGVVLWLGIYYHRDNQRDRGRAGDDLYYLGLLFTMCSLIHTLVPLLFSAAGDISARFEQLIGSFGIALVSTVAGILGRILLQSNEGADRGTTSAAPVRQRPASRTAAVPAVSQAEAAVPASSDTTQPMLDLRRNLSEASDAFVHFTRVTLAHGEQVKAHTERLIDNFNSHVDASARQRVSNTAAIWEEAASAMSAATDRLLGQIDEHTASAAHRTEATWEQVAAKSEATAQAARTRLAEDAEQMATLLARLATTNRALESLSAGVQSLRGNVAELGDETARTAIRVGEQSAATSQAQNALAEGAKRTQATTVQALQETAAQLVELRDGLTEQARLWQSATQDFAAATAVERQRQEEVANAARHSLGQLDSGINSARTDIAALGDTMKSAMVDFAAAAATERSRQAGIADAARNSLNQLAASVSATRTDIAVLGDTMQAVVADLAAAVVRAQGELVVKHAQQQRSAQRRGLLGWLAGLRRRLQPRLAAQDQAES